MIRLRRRIHLTLRHPVVGPLLLVVLAVLLAFVILHGVEHGVEGELFTCGILAAAALRLVVIALRRLARSAERAELPGRSPPRAPECRARLHPPLAAPAFFPLRR